jgi:hypothetical protein
MACGELGAVLPSSGSYRVDALINEISLDVCSLIKENDTVQPYFASSLADDPDVSGLMVFLETRSGEIAGGKVRYTLTVPEIPASDSPEEALADEIPPDEVPTAEIPPKEAPEETPAEEIPEDDSEDDKNQAEDQTEDQAENQIENQTVKKNHAEIYRMVKGADTFIPVKRLDKELPMLTLPKDLNIGQYTMVFQVLGANGVLYRAEKLVYYLGDAQFSLNDINRYLPDLSPNAQLIPPGTTVMLEARVDFDKRLDPYIVWYSGRKRISEGKISDGAAFILWKASEQTGFNIIRAEVFPFREVPGLKGKKREISLPISSKVAAASFFSNTGEFIHWYQFSGNLRDSITPMSTERALIPKGEKQGQWLPANNIYGLSAGMENMYILPAVSFVPSGETEGSGRLQFHFKPVSDGSFFKAVFNAAAPGTNTVEMELVLSGESLILAVTVPASGVSEKIEAYLPPSGQGNFVTAFIDFSMEEKRFAVNLTLENQESDPLMIKVIRLASPLSGECNFRLGTSVTIPVKIEQENTGEDQEIGELTETAEIAEIIEPEENESEIIEPEIIEPEKPVEVTAKSNEPYLPTVIFNEIAIAHLEESIMPPEVIEIEATEEIEAVLEEPLIPEDEPVLEPDDPVIEEALPENLEAE